MAVSISISIAQNSQSVANNTSNVTVKVTAKWTYGSRNANSKSGWLTIDGTKYTFSSSFNTGQSTSGSKVLYEKTVNVTHSSDGTKTLKCSASYTSGVSSGTVTASASKALTTIPRKSTLSVANGTLGTAQTLTITEKAAAFYHRVSYKCGTAASYIWGSSDTMSSTLSGSWTPPLSLAKQNTTGTSVSATFTLSTWTGSGGSLVGSNTYTRTFTIPASVKPSVSIAVSDPTGYATKYGAYVKGKSKIKVVTTPDLTNAQGATIKTYSVSANGSTYTKADITTEVVASTGTLTISSTVKDSRSRTASASTTISAIAYSAPKFTSMAVKRSGDGNSLIVTFNSSVSSLNNKNTAVYTIQYKKTTETEYCDPITLSDYTGNYAVSGGTYTFAADSTSSYDVLLTVTDDFGSIDRLATGSSISKLWSIFSKGKGIALGKLAEIADAFEVAWNSYFRKDVMIGNKEGYLDGKIGVFIDAEGYIHIQRDSSQGYHPYIAFLLDDNTEISGSIRVNSATGYMEFTDAAGYVFKSTTKTITSGAVPFGMHALTVGCSVEKSLSTSISKVTCGTVYSNNNAVTSGVLSASNGGIKVLRSGRYLVCATIYVTSTSVGTGLSGAIYTDSAATAQNYVQTGSRTYTNIPLVPRVLSVSAGATIYLYARNINEAVGTVTADNSTLLTVVALD